MLGDGTYNQVVIVSLVALIALGYLGSPVEATMDSSNETICEDGAVLPRWKPFENLSAGDRLTRGLIYLIVLFYLFVGVIIVTSRVMIAIEVIASPEKEITVKRKKGEPQILRRRFWNNTILNLTLMVLGSSALEIWLPIVELFGDDMEIRGVAFGTIMGCAAFRLHLITALCVFMVPTTEKRKTKSYDVLFIIFCWCILTYVWVISVLNQYSSNIIRVWEAILTLLCFPLILLTAYMDDQRFSILNWLCHQYKIRKKGQNETAADIAVVESGNEIGQQPPMRSSKGVVKDFEKTRLSYINILHQIRRRYPDCDTETLETLAMEEIMVQYPKTRAFYWMQANRKFTGGCNLMRKKTDVVDIDQQLTKPTEEEEKNNIRVFLDQQRIAVSKQAGKLDVVIKREGGNEAKTVSVDIRPENGTAVDGYDYVRSEGTYYFQAGRNITNFTLTIINSHIYKEERHFFVHLSNLKLCNPDGSEYTPDDEPTPAIQLVSPTTATVMILDDNHCGVFSFTEPKYEFRECANELTIKMTRFGGTTGQINIFYATSDGTAKAGDHYTAAEGSVAFMDKETETDLVLNIDPDFCFEEDLIFYIDLTDCKQVKDGNYVEYAKETTKLNEEQRTALSCKPLLGEIKRAQIKIKKNKEFQDSLANLLRAPKPPFIVGGTSWPEQFKKAITVPTGDDAILVEGAIPATPPSYTDYGLHFLTIFWKIVCAAIPPAGLLGGWPCVVVSVLLIGLLACFILDMGCGLACALDLPGFIIGITVMTVGICIPDLFASKLAAIDDKYADSSITYMTGSISVIASLGIGINWFIASIYHVCIGDALSYQHSSSVIYPANLFYRIAIVILVFLSIRRIPFIGGELGGPMMFRIPTIMFLVACWLAFVFMTIVELT